MCFFVEKIGPALSGFIVHAFGFRAMLYVISFLCLCYAPLMFYLRNPPAREEKMVTKFLLKIFQIIHCFF
jgi:DHA1 family solute carrier family 18 vesicular amine transporter 1/2